MKFNKTKEWLIEEYVIKNKKLEDVSKNCGLTIQGLQSLLTKWNIKKEIFNIPQDVLKDLVYNKGLTVQEISQFLKCGKTTIRRYLKKYNFKIQKRKEYNQYDDSLDTEICELYVNMKLSSVEIGKIFNLSHNTILKHLEKCGINRRTLSESQFILQNKEYPKDFLDKNIMSNLYLTKRLSKKDIAQQYKCDPCAVDLALKKLQIPIRNNSESKKQLMVGEKHPNWKDGITLLHQRLREYFRVNQVPIVAKRDNYTCQLCGKTHTILHVHHITPFSTILKNILLKHSNLDPIANVNELYEISIQDKSFCDLNNLITYCKDCHFYNIHKYKKNSLAENKPIELLEPSVEAISSQASLYNEEGSETIENTDISGNE